MKFAYIAGFALLCALAPQAPAGSSADKLQLESSMQLSGKIVVAPDGRVVDYHLDHADDVPTYAKAEIDKAAHAWRFAPVLRDGKAVTAKASMHVSLVARKIGKGKYAIHVGAAWFGDNSNEQRVTHRSRRAPSYPMQARRDRVSGIVYLVVRVDRQGHVDKVAAQQVNLYTRASPSEMKRYRTLFARASVRAARRWTFDPPSKGTHADDDHWVVRVPVRFRIRKHGSRRAYAYGEWQPYIVGPTRLIPWMHERMADAQPISGGPHPLHQSLHLLTPVAGG